MGKACNCTCMHLHMPNQKQPYGFDTHKMLYGGFQYLFMIHSLSTLLITLLLLHSVNVVCIHLFFTFLQSYSYFQFFLNTAKIMVQTKLFQWIFHLYLYLISWSHILLHEYLTLLFYSIAENEINYIL